MGCFISYVCVGHLNVNLGVYESQTASPSSTFASWYWLGVAYKIPATLPLLGTPCLETLCRPSAKRQTPMLSVKMSVRMCFHLAFFSYVLVFCVVFQVITYPSKAFKPANTHCLPFSMYASNKNIAGMPLNTSV